MDAAIGFVVLLVTLYVGISGYGYLTKKIHLSRIKRERSSEYASDSFWETDPCARRVVQKIQQHHCFGVLEFPVHASDPLMLYAIDDECADEILVELSKRKCAMRWDKKIVPRPENSWVSSSTHNAV